MGKSLAANIRILETTEILVKTLANEISGLIIRTVGRKEDFSLVLSGGETPKALYRVLSSQYRDIIPWGKIRFYFGDERYVPHEHPMSNFRMAKESLLDRIPKDPDNVYAVPTDYEEPRKAAAAYESTLREQFAGPWPRFDLVLLGMGSDGHTASLFPGSEALREKEKWVTVGIAPEEPKMRLTLTLPSISNSVNIFFLVTGEGKSAALRRAVTGTSDADSCPAGAVKPADGRLIWWVDNAAAGELTGNKT